MYNLSRARPEKPRVLVKYQRQKSAKPSSKFETMNNIYNSRPSNDEIGKIQTIFMPLDNGPFAILPPDFSYKRN